MSSLPAQLLAAMHNGNYTIYQLSKMIGVSIRDITEAMTLLVIEGKAQRDDSPRYSVKPSFPTRTTSFPPRSFVIDVDGFTE